MNTKNVSVAAMNVNHDLTKDDRQDMILPEQSGRLIWNPVETYLPDPILESSGRQKLPAKTSDVFYVKHRFVQFFL